MAEFLEGARVLPPEACPTGDSGFSAMGKPVPAYRRQAAYDALKQMGVEPAERRWDCVAAMSDRLERDLTYEAMAAGMQHVDLTGTYRVMATLLAADKPRVRVAAA